MGNMEIRKDIQYNDNNYDTNKRNTYWYEN
jgi:hypothetical protein